MNSHVSILRRGVMSLSLLLSLTNTLSAQLNRGIIEGIVTDPQGAVVPEVDVTITNVETNVAVPTKTNSTGYYRAVDLVPGKYRAHFVITGFTPVDIIDIDLRAGAVIQVNAQLKLGTTEKIVEVTAEIP